MKSRRILSCGSDTNTSCGWRGICKLRVALIFRLAEVLRKKKLVVGRRAGK